MPEQLTKDLEKLILKAGIDGALTEDAVAQFHALVKERDALAGELKTSIDARDALRKERDDARSMRDVLQVEVETWAGREQDLMDREEKCMRSEVEAEFNEKRVADHKSMFEIVFKGMHMRKQVVTPGFATVDQYGTRNQEFPDTTPVTEEE